MKHDQKDVCDFKICFFVNVYIYPKLLDGGPILPYPIPIPTHLILVYPQLLFTSFLGL